MSVTCAVAERVARITIDRPNARNALGPVQWQLLAEHVARTSADPDVRVLVITGAGGAFSAGGDVKTMPERLALDAEARKAQLLGDARVIRLLRATGKPVVARIDGACVGAGLSLALACDLRVASTRAVFGATFHRVGLTADFGLLHLLPRAVGHARAAELLMLGETVDAARAEAIGLVHRVVPFEALDAAVDGVARQLASGPPIAQALTKSGLREVADMDLDAALEWEAAAQAIASKTADAREGVAAFAEKRAPRFEGK